MSHYDSNDGNLDFTAFTSVTSQLFTYGHHREPEDRPTCGGATRKDLGSTHSLHCPH